MGCVTRAARQVESEQNEVVSLLVAGAGGWKSSVSFSEQCPAFLNLRAGGAQPCSSLRSGYGCSGDRS